MLWLLLIPVLLLTLVMEFRVWRAVTKLLYRTGSSLIAPAKHKDERT